MKKNTWREKGKLPIQIRMMISVVEAQGTKGLAIYKQRHL
jgi:hypothetical protein